MLQVGHSSKSDSAVFVPGVFGQRLNFGWKTRVQRGLGAIEQDGNAYTESTQPASGTTAAEEKIRLVLCTR